MPETIPPPIPTQAEADTFLQRALGDIDEEGGGYIAKAVCFDPGSDQSCELKAPDGEVIAPDSPFCSWAGWFRIPGSEFFNAAPTFAAADYWIEVPATLWDEPGQPYVLANNNKLGEEQSRYLAPAIGPLFEPDVWYWVAGHIDVGHDPGSRESQYYIGDTFVSLSPDNDGFDNGVAFDIPFTSEGQYFPPMIRSYGQIVEYAEVFVWPGLKIDWSIEVNRRLLYGFNGKPVDPAGAMAVFGQAAMAFSGDADTFIVNQGPVPFSVTLGTITNALTSPSD